MNSFLDKHFGRLGNRMFQLAFCYAYAKDHGLDYFYQDPKYFEKYADDIKFMFGEGIGYDNRVSIHIRAGKNPSIKDEPNYFENPFYSKLMESDYYKQAVALFPDDRFLIFSDNFYLAYEYINTILPQERYDVIVPTDDVKDLKQMAACKHNIIANSSYSYWAAYLNPNPDKKVVAPRAWYSDGIERTKCPQEWIRI